MQFQERKAEWYIYHPPKNLADLKGSSVLVNVETDISVVLFRVVGAGPSLVCRSFWSLLCLGWCQSWLPQGRNLDGAEQWKTSLGREDLSWDEWLAHWDLTMCFPPCFSPNVSNIFEKMADVFHWSVLNVACSSFTKVTQSFYEQHWCFLSLQWLGAGYCTSWKLSQSKVI